MSTFLFGPANIVDPEFPKLTKSAMLNFYGEHWGKKDVEQLFEKFKETFRAPRDDKIANALISATNKLVLNFKTEDARVLYNLAQKTYEFAEQVLQDALSFKELVEQKDYSKIRPAENEFLSHVAFIASLWPLDSLKYFENITTNYLWRSNLSEFERLKIECITCKELLKPLLL